MHRRRLLTTSILAATFAIAACEDDRINGGKEDTPPPASTQGKLEVTPAQLNFGDVMVNQSATLSVAAKNSGDGPLQLTAIAIDPGGEFTTTATPRVLQPGDTLQIEVTFQPTNEGAKTAVLNVDAERVQLSGNGAAIPCNCAAPPAASCDAQGNLHTFAPGICQQGACSFPETVTPCAGTCDAGIARCNSTCNPADEHLVAGGNNAIGAPALAFDGTDLGLAWFDGTPNMNSIGYTYSFVKLGLDGVPLTTPLTIGAGSVAHRPRLVSGAESYALAWSDVRNLNNEVYFQTIDAGGIPAPEMRLTTNPEVSFPATGNYSPDAAEYLIVFSEGDGQVRELFARRLDRSGAAIGADIQITSSGGAAEYSSVVWAGTTWAVSWYEFRGGVLRVFATFISSDGRLLGPELELSDGTSQAWLTDATWNGLDLGVVWQDSREGYSAIYFARIDPSGQLTSAPARISTIATRAVAPSIVWDRGVWVVAWASGLQNMEQIRGVTISADGTLGTEREFACGGGRGADPDLIPLADGVGMAWTDYRSGGSEIYFKKF